MVSLIVNRVYNKNNVEEQVQQATCMNMEGLPKHKIRKKKESKLTPWGIVPSSPPMSKKHPYLPPTNTTHLSYAGPISCIFPTHPN